MYPSRRKLSLAEKRARYEARALDIPDYTRENLRELSLVQEFEKRPHRRSQFPFRPNLEPRDQFLGSALRLSATNLARVVYAKEGVNVLLGYLIRDQEIRKLKVVVQILGLIDDRISGQKGSK